MIRSGFRLIVLSLAGPPLRADPEYKNMGSDIFDRQAKGEELIGKPFSPVCVIQKA